MKVWCATEGVSTATQDCRTLPFRSAIHGLIIAFCHAASQFCKCFAEAPTMFLSCFGSPIMSLQLHNIAQSSTCYSVLKHKPSAWAEVKFSASCPYPPSAKLWPLPQVREKKKAIAYQCICSKFSSLWSLNHSTTLLFNSSLMALHKSLLYLICLL